MHQTVRCLRKCYEGVKLQTLFLYLFEEAFFQTTSKTLEATEGPEIWSRYFQSSFNDFKICVAPENKGDIRASYAVPQVALNSRGSLDFGWDITDHRKRGAPSGSVNFVFVSCGTAVHLERHEKIRNIFCGIDDVPIYPPVVARPKRTGKQGKPVYRGKRPHVHKKSRCISTDFDMACLCFSCCRGSLQLQHY